MPTDPAPEKVAALAALEQAMGTLRYEALTVLTGLRATGYDVARIEEGEPSIEDECRHIRLPDGTCGCPCHRLPARGDLVVAASDEAVRNKWLGVESATGSDYFVDLAASDEAVRP